MVGLSISGLVPVAKADGTGETAAAAASKTSYVDLSQSGNLRTAWRAETDAPTCHECGTIMVRSGACHKCLNCGSTSGCS